MPGRQGRSASKFVHARASAVMMVTKTSCARFGLFNRRRRWGDVESACAPADPADAFQYTRAQLVKIDTT
jgi:hypothetical protein